jgi:hypothetical protein
VKPLALTLAFLVLGCATASKQSASTKNEESQVPAAPVQLTQPGANGGGVSVTVSP